MEEEKHKCKLCFRFFTNGKALGGHMRSHMMNLYVPPKPKKKNQEFSQEIEESLPSSSSSSSYSSSESEQEKGLMSKGFKKKQRKRRIICLMDPTEFEANTTGSVVVDQDYGEEESETESLKKSNRRIRRSRISEPNFKNPKIEPVNSSISDTTPDEDVAYCLIMLSRDQWRKTGDEEIEVKFNKEKAKKVVVTKIRTKRRGKYRCETCKKVFGSYQALGGHRASHKRITTTKVSTIELEEASRTIMAGKFGINAAVVEEKVHECPVCFRVFASGQALGGHKRSHVVGAGKTAVERFDLNLPAPMEDDFCCF